MALVKFGDVVNDVKVNVDRNNNPYEYYIAGDHMNSEDLTLRRKGKFATDDVGPAFIRIFKPGQVLYGSRRTYLKKVAVADFEGITANTTFVLETKNKEFLSQRLLPFIMLTDGFTNWSIKKSKGSTNPYILFSDLAEYEFDLPQIQEQERLAELLWSAYELKESYKKLIAATEEMVKTQFIEVMKNSHSHKSFNELFEYISRGKSPQYVDSSNVLILNQACIYWENIRWENVKYQDPDKLANKRVLENGDILLNSTGTGTLGRCVVYNKPLDKNKYVVDGHVTTIKVNQSILLPDIFCMYLSLVDTQKEIYINCVRGSTNQIELSKEKLLLLDMPLISIDKQEEFLSIKRQTDKSKAELQQSIKNIDKVMKSLLP